MLTRVKRLLLACTMTGLVASNILALTNTAFNTALSGLMGSYLGIRTVSAGLKSQLATKDAKLKRHTTAARKQKAATKRFGKRLTTRTKRVAAKSIAAIPAESIPFLGVAVLIADTGYELYAACETLNDLDQLYLDLGIAQDMSEDTLHSVCNPALPDAEEVWREVLGSSNQWIDEVRGAM